jgi:hypothetical protein
VREEEGRGSVACEDTSGSEVYLNLLHTLIIIPMKPKKLAKLSPEDR